MTVGLGDSISVLFVRPMVVLEDVFSLELFATVRIVTAVGPKIDLVVQLVTSQLAVSSELLVTAVHVANEQVLVYCGRERQISRHSRCAVRSLESNDSIRFLIKSLQNYLSYLLMPTFSPGLQLVLVEDHVLCVAQQQQLSLLRTLRLHVQF